MKILLSKTTVLITIFAAPLFISCNNRKAIPDPEIYTAYPQPETEPLVLSDPKPLHWDTLAKGIIKPTVFPLNFNKMKGIPYDSSGFKPLPEKPYTTDFNLESLPSKPFDLDKIPAIKLNMKSEPLPAELHTEKVQQPERVVSSTLDLKELKLLNENTFIYSFIKDSNGFIWIGTQNGVYRFDGTQLTTVLPGVHVRTMAFDASGKLWVAAWINNTTTELIQIDFVKRTINHTTLNFEANYILKILTAPDGKMWVPQSITSPLMVIDPGNMTYRILDSNSGLKSSKYYCASFDRKGRTWLGTRNGIEIIDPGSKRLYRLEEKPFNGKRDTTTAIIESTDGRMWAVSYYSGIRAIDIDNGKITHYTINPGQKTNTYNLLFDKKGKLWIGTSNGIFILKTKNLTFRTIGVRDGLLSKYVIELIDDKAGNILAVNSGDSYDAIFSIGQYGKTVYPFKNTNIISVIEDSKGKLWVGTDNGLIVVDSARQHYFQFSQKDGLAFPYIQSVTEDEGNVVITTNGGYNIYYPQKEEWERVTKKDGLITDTVNSIMTDQQGNVWFGTNSSGIIKYDSTHHLYLGLNTKGGLNGNRIVKTSHLPNNNIVVSPDESGLSFINPEENTIQTIQNSGDVNKNGDKAMTLDSHGRIWEGFASSGQSGMFLIDLSKKTLTHFTTQNGLSANSIYSLLEYKDKFMAGTGEKINVITPPELSPSKKWSVDVLLHSESLKKNYTSFMSDAITRRGNYLWGDDGLAVIHGIATDTSTGVDYVTGLKVMGKDLIFSDSSSYFLNTDTSGLKKNLSMSSFGYVAPGPIRWDSISGLYNLPVNISFPYDQNSIQISFTEKSMGRTDSIKFAYILDGIDKQWTFTNDNHTETYLNLTPGDYTFKVASRWKNGKWNKPAVFSFSIRPPWYLTWWAYLIYIIAALSLLRLYIIIRSRKLMQENKLLEEKVNKRTEELQQSYRNVEKLEEIGKKITSSLSIEKIIGTVYNNVNALMDANVFGIGIYNESLKRIEFPATYEEGKQLPFYTNSIDEENRFAPVCFNNNKEVIIGNLGEEYKKYIQKMQTPREGEQPLSLIFLPLVAKDKKLGVITVQSFKKDAYNDYHLYMLRNIAIYAAIAIENATSYEDLKTTQQQLIQSEKMASLGELTAGIAHEIQNPLNFVNNFSEVSNELIEELRTCLASRQVKNYELKIDDPGIKKLLNDIEHNLEKINHHGKRADAIVKGMLQHSRNNTGQKELTDINALCDEYLRLAYHGMRAKDKNFNCEIKTDFDEGIGKINIVPQDIGRVILNLINNAFYAVNEKKKLSANSYQPTAKITTRKIDDKVEIIVADNGNGIPSTIKDKIFQPFFTTKPTGQGTGLGLSLSYDIVKAHGGEIKVNSTGNDGTIFIVNLPIG